MLHRLDLLLRHDLLVNGVVLVGHDLIVSIAVVIGTGSCDLLVECPIAIRLSLVIFSIANCISVVDFV